MDKHIARVMKWVHKTPECWEWVGAKSTAGYGRVCWHGRVLQAHRVVYEWSREPIPDGLDLDHLCRNRACVRPDHLEPVTRRVNLLRGETIAAALRKRTHCRNGHEFTPENIYEWRGGRYCRTCREAVQAGLDRRVMGTVAAECVMCGSSFTYERGVGTRPNVCSPECRKDRQRKAARECQRRRRARA